MYRELFGTDPDRAVAFLTGGLGGWCRRCRPDGLRLRRWGYVTLGDPIDCETCGINNDRVEWHYHAKADHVSASYGCYGGEQFTFEDLDEAVAYCESLGKRFPSARADLADEAEEMRERVTARRSRPDPPHPPPSRMPARGGCLLRVAALKPAPENSSSRRTGPRRVGSRYLRQPGG